MSDEGHTSFFLQLHFGGSWLEFEEIFTLCILKPVYKNRVQIDASNFFIAITFSQACYQAQERLHMFY